MSKPAEAPKAPAKGGARVGGAAIGARIKRGVGGRMLQMPDVMQLQFHNKGGVVKKK
jgi:hypothetical protein